MKRIIVPTDFSKNAFNALKYAINIANQFDECTIHLLHVYTVSSDTGISVHVTNFMRDKADKDLSVITKEVKLSLFNSTSFIAKSVEGDPVNVINKFAEVLEADFVIMGTQGASGLKSIFLGTNTTGVLKKCNRPVLAVPANYKYQQTPRRIALAIDSNKNITKDRLIPLVEIAKSFKSEMKIIHVGKVEKIDTAERGNTIPLSGIEYTFHEIINKDVNEGINQFIQKNRIDFLCLIHRQRNFFDRLLFASIIETEALDCSVPLLVLTHP